MAWAKARTAIFMGAGATIVAGAAAVTISTVWHRPEAPVESSVPAVVQSQPMDNPSPPARPQEQAAPVTTREPQASPKVVAAIPQSQPAPLIYPIAPRLSVVFAVARSNAAAVGGPMIIPPEIDVQMQYDNLFQKLNLTTDQTNAFTKIMLEKQASTTAVIRESALHHDSLVGLTDEQIATAFEQNQKEMQVLLGPVEQATDLQIKQLLGSDDLYTYYKIYTDQTKERTLLMGGYREGLDANGVAPLTLDQVEQLVILMYQARVTDGGDAAIQVRQVSQAMDQAGTFLSSDQLQVLTKYTNSLSSAPMNGMGGAIAIGGGASAIGSISISTPTTDSN